MISRAEASTGIEIGTDMIWAADVSFNQMRCLHLPELFSADEIIRPTHFRLLFSVSAPLFLIQGT